MSTVAKLVWAACLLFGQHTVVYGVQVVEKLYQCNDNTGFCELLPLVALGADIAVGTPQNVCMLTCKGTIWPAPLEIEMSHQIAEYCEVQFTAFPDNALVKDAIDSFLTSVGFNPSQPRLNCPYPDKYIEIVLESPVDKDLSYYQLTLDTDEAYSLQIKGGTSSTTATIAATTFFGTRHALESLSQLMATRTTISGNSRSSRDNTSSTVGVVASDVRIFDTPAYPYRGVLLDLSRHYLSTDKIKAIIRGMGYNKLNRLHLHITDTASFPLDIEGQPNMARYGAYGNDMQYDTDMMNDLTRFAKVHGVAIVPEIDTPSHVNEGWQWGALEGKGDFAICTTNWTITALEPPGGHLNIANENVYPVLQSVYEYVISTFDFPDLFHIGGDEVVVGSDETYAACWNSSIFGTDILNKLTELGLNRGDSDSFYQLWNTFTHRASAMVANYYTQFHRTHKLIIWGGNAEPDEEVTYNMVARQDVVEELPPSDYIIQVWDDSVDSIAPTLIDKGYEIILANYDYVYLDCGQEGFTNPGGYWCNPYHEWFHIYQYMADMQQKWDLPQPTLKHNTDKKTDPTGRVIGSEILLWGEENGEQTVEKKIWPRGAALAEALWSNPQSGWYAADPRMQMWRNKMVSRGISAEEIQPLWCAQNGPYSCTIDMGVPQ